MTVTEVMVDDIDSVSEAVIRLDRSTPWELTAQYPLEFSVYHPQGITRTDNHLLVSSVEILEGTVRYPEPRDGYDRSPGRGRGHVFALDMEGRLVRQTTVGEGSLYHPGGIAFDGEIVWVSTSEYRPDSQAIVYRMDPDTLEATEVFRFPDHIGAIAHDRLTGLLHAATWGSSQFLALDVNGRVLHRYSNNSRYVDFQDCAAVGYGKLVCTGVTEYPLSSGGVFSLGGITVVDVSTGYMQHEVPVTALSPAGRVVTFNAVHLDVHPDTGRLRMYAVPDDGLAPGESTLLVMEPSL